MVCFGGAVCLYRSATPLRFERTPDATRARVGKGGERLAGRLRRVLVLRAIGLRVATKELVLLQHLMIGGHVRAAYTCPGEEEPLGGGRASGRRRPLELGGAESEAQSAVVRDVFAECQLAVDVFSRDRVVRILIGKARGPARVLARILRRPP